MCGVILPFVILIIYNSVLVYCDAILRIPRLPFRQKWTLFDEATRVPLIVHHPSSPFAGQHYRYPVELLDVGPTILELCDLRRHQNYLSPLQRMQGKSLAPVIVPPPEARRPGATERMSWWHYIVQKASGSQHRMKMPILNSTCAISQLWMCATRRDVEDMPHNDSTAMRSRVSPWRHCRLTETSTDIISVMGYSLRFLTFRYTVWLHFDLQRCNLMRDVAPYAEEYYDHSDTRPSSFAKLETINIVDSIDRNTIESLRNKLLQFLHRRAFFHYSCRGNKLLNI